MPAYRHKENGKRWVRYRRSQRCRNRLRSAPVPTALLLNHSIIWRLNTQQLLIALLCNRLGSESARDAEMQQDYICGGGHQGKRYAGSCVIMDFCRTVGCFTCWPHSGSESGLYISLRTFTSWELVQLKTSPCNSTAYPNITNYLKYTFSHWLAFQLIQTLAGLLYSYVYSKRSSMSLGKVRRKVVLKDC